MQNDNLVDAIKKLRPNAEFKFENSDYSTIEWFNLEGDAPTQDEIDIAIEEIKAVKQAKIEAAAQAKIAAEAKLVALGLTAEDLKALGFQNNK